MLLPFRGAVAATMLCAEPGETGQLIATVAHAHHGVPSEPETYLSPLHGHDQADKGSIGSEDGPKGDSCLICASGCHAAAMVTDLPSAPAAMPVASVVFPSLHVPAPDFQSEGQDRPPRAR